MRRLADAAAQLVGAVVRVLVPRPACRLCVRIPPRQLPPLRHWQRVWAARAPDVVRVVVSEVAQRRACQLACTAHQLVA